MRNGLPYDDVVKAKWRSERIRFESQCDGLFVEANRTLDLIRNFRTTDFIARRNTALARLRPPPP